MQYEKDQPLTITYQIVCKSIICTVQINRSKYVYLLPVTLAAGASFLNINIEIPTDRSINAIEIKARIIP